jgi:excisionase family DNA binding protein
MQDGPLIITDARAAYFGPCFPQAEFGEFPAGWVLALMTADETTPKSTIIDQLGTRASLLTGAEVMALLGVTRNTLCRWCRTGLIPFLRVGKDNRFDPTALAAWLETRRSA